MGSRTPLGRRSVPPPRGQRSARRGHQPTSVPLRVDRLSEDPRAAGFPPGHPRMETFLGVPVLVRGEAWGNLYLCEKADGEPFSAADEQAVVVLAEWAGIAIGNARLYAAQRAAPGGPRVRRAAAGGDDRDRARARRGDRACAYPRADRRPRPRPDRRAWAGDRAARARGPRRRRMRRRRARRRSRRAPAAAPATSCGAGGLLVPLVFRGQSLGMLAAFGAAGGERRRLAAAGLRGVSGDRRGHRAHGRGAAPARRDRRGRGGAPALGARAARRRRSRGSARCA